MSLVAPSSHLPVLGAGRRGPVVLRITSIASAALLVAMVGLRLSRRDKSVDLSDHSSVIRDLGSLRVYQSNRAGAKVINLLFMTLVEWLTVQILRNNCLVVISYADFGCATP